MAVPIIQFPLLGIVQDLIGLGGLFEAFLGLPVSRVAVGMVLEGHFPVGLLDLLFAGLPGNPQNFVIIPLVVIRGHFF